MLFEDISLDYICDYLLEGDRCFWKVKMFCYILDLLLFHPLFICFLIDDVVVFTYLYTHVYIFSVLTFIVF